MALRCNNCDQIILPTDTVCWHCGKELESVQTSLVEEPETGASTDSNESSVISVTAVSIFALITLITIILFILVTNILAGYTPS